LSGSGSGQCHKNKNNHGQSAGRETQETEHEPLHRVNHCFYCKKHGRIAKNCCAKQQGHKNRNRTNGNQAGNMAVNTSQMTFMAMNKTPKKLTDHTWIADTGATCLPYNEFAGRDV